MTGRVIRLDQLLDKLEKEQITEEERKELIMLADNMTEEEYLGEMPSGRGSFGISDGSGDNKRGRSVCKDTDGVHIRERHRDVHDAYGIEQNERLRASEGRGISNGNVQAGGFVHEPTQDGEYAISEVS